MVLPISHNGAELTVKMSQGLVLRDGAEEAKRLGTHRITIRTFFSLVVD